MKNPKRHKITLDQANDLRSRESLNNVLGFRDPRGVVIAIEDGDILWFEDADGAYQEMVYSKKGLTERQFTG